MNSTLIGAGASRFLRLPHACPTCNGSVNLETMICDKCGANLGRPLGRNLGAPLRAPKPRPPSGAQPLNDPEPFTFMNLNAEHLFVPLVTHTLPRRKS